MPDVVRVTAADVANEDPWSWADAPARAPAPDPYTPEDGEAAVQLLGEALTRLKACVADVEAMLPDAVRAMTESYDIDGIVQTVDLLVWLRKQVQLEESMLARVAGQSTAEVAYLRKGIMPDGRLYEVKRGADHREWKHEDWKHDVRAQALSKLGVSEEAVDPTTGEQYHLHDLLRMVQEVHGSTGPRLTQLKGLGLDPEDYSTEVKGTYSVVFSSPHDASPG